MQQESLPASVKQRAKDKLERDLGPAFLAALRDSATLELMLNEDGKLWQEKIGDRMRVIGQLRPAQAEAIIKTVAGFHGYEVTRQQPILEAEFPLDGSRFAAQMPPIVSQPTFALRKKAVSVIPLDSYVESGVLTPAHRDVLRSAIQPDRVNLPPATDITRAAGAEGWTLLAAPEAEGNSLPIRQQAWLRRARLAPGAHLDLTLDVMQRHWLQILRGGVTVDGHALAAGDALGVYEAGIRADLVATAEGAEALLITLPG